MLGECAVLAACFDAAPLLTGSRDWWAQIMLGSMQRLDGSRISAEAGVGMLRAGLQAVGMQRPLLDKLPAGAADAGKTALSAALDAIFSELLRDGLDSVAQWRIGRNSLFTSVVEVGLSELAKAGADAQHVQALRAATQALADGVTRADVDAFTLDLRTRLQAA